MISILFFLPLWHRQGELEGKFAQIPSFSLLVPTIFGSRRRVGAVTPPAICCPIIALWRLSPLIRMFPQAEDEEARLAKEFR